MYPGVFISIEGPNGCGKSTFIKKLALMLQIHRPVFTTKEPTNTKLGQFTRNNEGNLHGLSYAYLICADRCSHIENEIIPHLEQGNIVITDRYIESSLVLQRFEGVPTDTIWQLNSNFLTPDLSIRISADAQIIDTRLHERSTLTSFEQRMTRQEELLYYEEAQVFLEKHGFNYLSIVNNTPQDLEKNLILAYHRIVDILENTNGKN